MESVKHRKAKEEKNIPFLKFKKIHYLTIIVLILIIIILILSIYLVTVITRKCSSSETYTTTKIDNLIQSTTITINQDNPEPLPLQPPDLQNFMIERSAWGGKAPLNLTHPLRHPIPWVIISHTATPSCKTASACTRRVQTIQNYHMNGGKMFDIRYSFLVGGDGNVYVGRGWDVVGSYGNYSIEMTFIGNYIYDHLTTSMIDVARRLLDYGVKSGKLSKNYKLVAHNQTVATQSPGPNVYREIKTWSHFAPGKFISTS